MKKTITLILLMLLPAMGAQQSQTIVALRKKSNPCGSVPAYKAQYKSTTTAGGGVNVGTWTDSSGNSNTLIGNVGGPKTDTTDPTPNGQTTVMWTNAAFQIMTLTNSITISTGVTMCGVYKLTNFSTFAILTGNTSGNGNPTYGIHSNNTGIAGVQKMNDENVDIVVGTGAATLLWADTCATYTVGGAWAAYRNGSADGTGTSAVTFSKPITTVGGTTGVAGSSMTVAEIDIMDFAINSTQATAIHNCAVATYGVP